MPWQIVTPDLPRARELCLRCAGQVPDCRVVRRGDPEFFHDQLDCKRQAAGRGDRERSMMVRFPLLGLLAGCVAGSEGPTDSGGPSMPEPGLQADLAAGPIEVPDHIRVDSILEMTIGVRNGGTRIVDPGWVI